jgi:hypothetical protein
MAQTENTAVNRLVELAQQKPLDDGGAFDDLFVDSTARAARDVAKKALPPPFRSPGGTPAPQLIPAAPPPAMARERVPSATGGHPAAPPPVPPRPSQQIAAVAPPPMPRPSQQLVAVAPSRDIDMDDEPTALAPEPKAAPKLPPPPVAAQAPAFPGFEDGWFEESRAVARQEDADELFVQTHGVPRVRRNNAVWYVLGAFALGLGIAALLFWPGDDAPRATSPKAAAAAVPAPVVTPAPAPEPVVTPAPAPEPVVTPAPAPVEPAAVVPLPGEAPVETAAAPAPVAADGMVTITFTSTPAGASVLLVDNGTTLPIGKTPVQLQVSAGKHYQAMFSLDGHASALVPVDPSVSQSVMANLAGNGAVADDSETVAAPAPSPADNAEPQIAQAPATNAAKAVAEDRGAEQARAAAKKDKAAKKAPAKKVAKAEPTSSGGRGTLKIGAKPPCDIFIDGKKTGLVTPQAAIKLSAGKHTITLVNKEHGIKEKLSVTIEAGETTKVIKDLTSRM